MESIRNVRIGMVKYDHTVESIFCENADVSILKKFYCESVAVNKILALGDIKEVKPIVGDIVPLGSKSEHHNSYSEYIAQHSNSLILYDYVWYLNGELIKTDDKSLLEKTIEIDSKAYNSEAFSAAAEALHKKLGLCGCGLPSSSAYTIMIALDHIKNYITSMTYYEFAEESVRLFGPNHYFMYYVMDLLGLTDHGSSVPGWLSDEGKEILENLKTAYG